MLAGMYLPILMVLGGILVFLALAVLVLLAAIGYLQLRSLGSYNPPRLPPGAPGEPQKGKVIMGEHACSSERPITAAHL